jgi:hypothetical protein
MDAAVAQQWRQHTVDTLAAPSSAQWQQLLQGYAPAAVISVQTPENTLRNRYLGIKTAVQHQALLCIVCR